MPNITYCRYCNTYSSGHSPVCKELYIFALHTELKAIRLKMKKIKKLIADDINLETTT